MRLISAAKLRSAQNAISNMVSYEESLKDIFAKLSACKGASKAVAAFAAVAGSRTAVVLVTSNQSLCGGFNAGLVRAFAAEGFDPASTTVYAIGKFGLKAARKSGYDTVDLCKMAEKADYDASVALSEKLSRDFLEGDIGRVVVIYSHFASASTLPVKVEDYLPLSSAVSRGDNDRDVDNGADYGSEGTDYLIEPSPAEFLELLLPKVLRLAFHTILLDAQAAEHAARTLAMQIASDNAEDLISELSLQYNKLRQQAITNEILDLVGGQAATNQ